ncbi:hypothetical protein LEMLEM_LOCUS20329 [Lemmus lemmus]
MSKEVKTMRDSPTETVCLSQWELTNSNWTKSCFLSSCPGFLSWWT